MGDDTLGARISKILKEQRLKKAGFARALGVTPNYIYLLTSGRKQNISETLALLIEQTYGYRARWVLTGQEPIRVPPSGPPEEGA